MGVQISCSFASYIYIHSIKRNWNKVFLHLVSTPSTIMKLAVVVFLAISMVQAGQNNTCPLEDVSYVDWELPNQLARFWPIESWQKCGEICHTHKWPSSCEFWTLDTGICILFDSDDGFNVEPTAYSGDKDCYA